MRPHRPLATMASAHLPRLPVFVFPLLVFLGAHVPSSHGSPAPSPLLPLTSYDPSICLEKKCGGIDIRYPFYLSSTTRETPDYTTYYSCGYTDLEISCQWEARPIPTPVMRLGGDSYTVLDIFYDNYTIILADSDVLGVPKCPAVRHNVSFGDVWLHNTISNENLTFFFGCDSPPPGSSFSNYQIDCNGFKSPFGDGLSFVFTQDDQAPEHGLVCNKTVSVPVNRGILDMMASNRTKLRSGGYGDVLQNGFELVWSYTTWDPCYQQCEQSAGQCAYSSSREFLGCLCNDGKVGNPDCNHIISASTPAPRRKRTRVTVGVTVAAAGVVVLSVAIFFFIKRKRKQKNVINSSSKLLKYSGSGGTPRVGDMESGSIEDLPTHLFTYEELEEATNCFDENRELGDGGFGAVYKGYLKDGRVVAVKRLYSNSYRRVEQFQNEAAILSGLRHPNLVMFYGCTSSQSRDLLLVYEFVANGTVADHLHGPRAPERALSWPLRLSIAVESAAALTYLHAIEPPVVHRDVKTTNILLDADYHVKVADFGLSRLFPLDVTHVSTAPQGTPGYVDPEYHQCYQLTDKSDVYSFGVVLVELISSKPAVDITRHRNEINLAGMAISKIQKCQLEELVDLDLGYETDPATKKMMTMVAELAFRCLQQNGEMRPPIKEVLEVLRSIQDECLAVEKNGDKNKDGAFSPTTVHAPWESRETTPNTSRD